MANKPGEANFFPDVPQFPSMGTFQPVYGKFDLTTYIQGASDYEIMAFLVGKYNACLEAYGNITKLSTDTITACKQLQDWINSWFTNLDVQEEINNKLDRMVADGSFGTLLHQTFDAQINQQTTNAVTQWLVANVTPTGSAVVVDKSLSIEGAAADAKYTSILCRANKPGVPTSADLNHYQIPGTYILTTATTLVNAPANLNRGMLKVDLIPKDDGFSNNVVQYFYSFTSGGGIYYRTILNNVANEWISIVFSQTEILNDSDLNEYTHPGLWVFKGATLTNSPYNLNRGLLLVAEKMQFFYSIEQNKGIYCRQLAYGNFTNWNTITNTLTPIKPKTLDLNHYQVPGTYILTTATTLVNAPANLNRGMLKVDLIPKDDGFSNNVVQYFYSFTSGGGIYYRTILNNVANEWINITRTNLNNPLRNKSWVVLGDSRSIPVSPHTTSMYFDLIASANDISVTSYAVSGYSSKQLMEEINKINSTPDIISIYIGVNDWCLENPTPIGTFDGTETNTFYYYIKQAITTLQTKYPNSTLFFITFQPNAAFPNLTKWNEPNAIGKYYEEYNEVIRECCKYYSVPYYDDDYNGNDSVKNTAISKLYYTDGLHQNLIGSRHLAGVLEPFMKEIVSTY